MAGTHIKATDKRLSLAEGLELEKLVAEVRRQQAVVTQQPGEITVAQLAERENISVRAARYRLTELVQLGLATKRGRNNIVFYRWKK